MTRMNLHDVILAGANLGRANLSESILQGADLTDAWLEDAKLSGASFLGADLSRSRLRGADLSSSEFPDANLAGANISEANLSGVLFSLDGRQTAKGLTQAQLDRGRADVANPPVLVGVLDSETGEQLVWRGQSLQGQTS